MATGTVRLKLVSLDEITLRPGETIQLVRHRLMMVVYMAVVVLLVMLNANGTTRELPLELRAPVYIVGAFVSTLTIVAALLFAEAGARKGRDLVVPASPVFFLSALLALSSGEGLSMLVVAGPPMNFVEGLLLVFFYYILTEIIVGLTVHYVLPPALAEIRGELETGIAILPPSVVAPPPLASAQSGLSIAAQSNATQSNPPLSNMASTAVVAPVSAVPANLTETAGSTVVPLRRMVPVHIGSRQFDAAAMQRIEAEGNYVRIITQLERKLLPGPFSAVVAQMPQALGRQISRSVWVATATVVDLRRDGRDLFLRTMDGAELRVATGRQDQLRDWLAGFKEGSQKAQR